MIKIVDYDRDWPARFETLRDRHVQALRNVEIVSIEHVGSTAVPGLAAKPIIDVDIIVTPEHVEAALAALEATGFRLVGTRGIDDRWALDEPPGLPATNTYVIIADSLALRNHLGVRDVLRADPVLRNEYASVKQDIARTASGSADYTERKSAFLATVLARAGLSEAELRTIEESNRAG